MFDWLFRHLQQQAVKQVYLIKTADCTFQFPFILFFSFDHLWYMLLVGFLVVIERHNDYALKEHTVVNVHIKQQ